MIFMSASSGPCMGRGDVGGRWCSILMEMEKNPPPPPLSPERVSEVREHSVYLRHREVTVGENLQILYGLLGVCFARLRDVSAVGASQLIGRLFLLDLAGRHPDPITYPLNLSVESPGQVGRVYLRLKVPAAGRACASEKTVAVCADLQGELDLMVGRVLLLAPLFIRLWTSSRFGCSATRRPRGSGM